MNKKKCTRCKDNKLLSEFNKNKTKKDGLNNICRLCSQSNSREYYKVNNVVQRKMINDSRVIRKDEARTYVYNYLLKHPCIKCDEKDPIVLEFDHLDMKTKFSTITELVANGYSLNVIKKEIAKCVVLCANCHRRKTAKQLGWYRFNMIK